MDSLSEPERLLREFERTGDVVRWPVPEPLRSAPAVVFRDLGARKLAHQPVPEIVRSTMHVDVADVGRLLALAAKHVLPEPLRGVGVELGAGTGLLAVLAARSARVRGVLAVEVCAQMARLIVPKIASWALAGDAAKVVPVVGSFNDLRLPDGSVDFAIEKDSFHHSDDLPKTLGEAARVLKPGGWLLCFDRYHPDSVTDEEVREMLSRVYSRRFLIAHGYPPDAVLTRRDNGEHEYRLFEWKAAFEAARLKLVTMAEFHKRLPWDVALAGLVSVLPRRVRPIHRRARKATCRSVALWIAQHAGVQTLGRRPLHVIQAPERTTLFLLRKA